MLQLLLVKLHDEHAHSDRPSAPLILQDFTALGVDPVTAKSAVDGIVKLAVEYYQSFLPETVEKVLPIAGDTLMEVMRILAPIKIVSMTHSVIQDFYMYFAKHMYKWDLAQYFTPTNVTDFIVDVLNPRQHEHIRDPACGSADFLTAAFRRGQRWHDYSSSIGGSDVSKEAVQVAVLNMILNGDGKTNIREEGSLLKIESNESSCNIVICNPPFGTKITERDSIVLSNFDLGHEWEQDDLGRWQKSNRRLDKQESGVLFAEACARLVRPGGRFALIVPNGYLGNRSQRYMILREWILRHCRIAVIVGLPRFAFAASGASVAASIIFCERRSKPLVRSESSEGYEFCVEIVDRVGWKLGDRRGEPVYKRDPEDGTYLVNADDDQILDSDFAETRRQNSQQ